MYHPIQAADEFVNSAVRPPNGEAELIPLIDYRHVEVAAEPAPKLLASMIAPTPLWSIPNPRLIAPTGHERDFHVRRPDV